MSKPDFSGWATIENLQSGDLRSLPPGEPETYHPQFFRVYNLYARVTYKPGTRIVVEPETWGICVNVWIPTVDANDMDKFYEGRFYMWEPYDVFEQQTDDELITWLLNNLACFETHEVMEFFKVGGKHVRNPHPFEDPIHGDYLKEHGSIRRLKRKEPNEV